MAVSYFQQSTFSDAGVTFSIDMVRLSGHFLNGICKGRDQFLDWLGRQGLLQFEHTEYTGDKIGKFRDLFVFDFGDDATAVLMLCQKLGSGRWDWTSWVLEFNPNKVACFDEFRNVHRVLLVSSLDSTIKRWDLACDIPVARRACVLVKDQRKYALVRCGDDDTTEYLGRRNVVGFCKLYNKALERGLEGDLTRLEVTLGYPATYDEMRSVWPKCHVYSDLSLDGLSDLLGTDTLSDLGKFVVRSIVDNPDQENWISGFNRRTKKKLHDTLDRYHEAVVPSAKAFSLVAKSLEMYLVAGLV